MTLVNGFLPLQTLSRDARCKLRNEAAGSGAADESAKVGDRAAAHAFGLQPTGEFVEEHLGLLAALAQQQARCIALLRQQHVWKDQVTTTTASRTWRSRFARRALWLY